MMTMMSRSLQWRESEASGAAISVTLGALLASGYPGIASLDIDEANNVLQMTLEDRQSSVATNSTCWLLRIAWHPEH
jgi:hypothetical protein